jgi:hypothetical protein
MCAYDSGVRRDDGRKNEFNALIIAKMAAKMCESYSGERRDDGRKYEFGAVYAHRLSF